MNEKLNYFTAIKFLSKYIKKYKSNFILFYIGWFFETILSIVIPIIFGVMIDEIVYYQNLDTFIKISLIFLMILVFSCVLYFFIYAQHHYLMSMYTFDIKMDAFRRMQEATAEFMNNISTGDVMADLQDYSEECMHFVIRNVIHFVNGIISIIVISVYLFFLDWKIGASVLIMAPIAVLINIKFSGKIRNYSDKRREDYGNYVGWLFEILSSLRDIRLLNAQKKVDEKFTESHKKIFTSDIKSSISIMTAENIISFVNLLIQLVIFTIVGFLSMTNSITIGSFIVSLSFFSILESNIKGTSSRFLDMSNRISYIQHVYELMNAPIEDSRKEKNDLCITEGNISFNNLKFTYNDGSYVLKGLDLNISSGDRFALVGKSGCGKTTLAYILLGFYQPQCGEIIIDGQKLSECNLKSIRQNIGLVAQDVLIFNGSIKENILLGNKKATDEEIVSACKQVGLWDFITTLPGGLDTVIGTEGMNVSGGQKQRIAIARIYIKNPKIIIFDEATSALDSQTEIEIHNAWKDVLAGRTSIVIAHRQSSVMMCDKAAIIENGKICEIGIPEKMIRESNTFKTLFAIKEFNNYVK